MILSGRSTPWLFGAIRALWHTARGHRYLYWGTSGDKRIWTCLEYPQGSSRQRVVHW